MTRITIITAILFFIDLYFFKGISLLINSYSLKTKFWVNLIYWLSQGILLLNLAYVFSNFHFIRFNAPYYFRFLSSIFIIFFFTKLFFISFHLLDDIYFLFQKGINYLGNNGIDNDPDGRRKFITQLGLGAASFIFGAYSYGVIKGKYAFRVLKEKIKTKRLPIPFHGLKIVHISDFHLGSFLEDFDDVQKGFDMINAIEPDLLLFTGDLVNENAREAEAWIEPISKLKAKMGKYSIFGNHDYADYGGQSKSDKIASIKRLKEIHHEMGFMLLEDEHIYLEKEDTKIGLIGMHNWGKGFHQIGDLNKALDGIDKNVFKILMSHDPTLWEEKVENKLDIDLTLSGHTHGMQMGIEIPRWGIKWSPIKLRYKKWAGLYGQEHNKIYINRGFGFLGFPGRTGIPPEITLIELEAEV